MRGEGGDILCNAGVLLFVVAASVRYCMSVMSGGAGMVCWMMSVIRGRGITEIVTKREERREKCVFLLIYM